MEIHVSATKHGILRRDILHAVNNAMTTERMDRATLFLGPARDGSMLEVVSVRRRDGSELVIHAMPMRSKYLRLLGSRDV